MKSFTKKILCLATMLVIALGAAIVAACSGSSYTVKVVDENDAPVTGVKVQLCEIGEGAFCYTGVEVDQSGTAVIDVNDLKALAPEGKVGETLDVHIQDIAGYMVYEPCTVTRGKTVTVKIRENRPTDGTGFGELQEGQSSTLDPTTFDPYIVGEGSYRVNLTEKDKWVYFAFKGRGTGEGVFVVSSDDDGAGVDSQVCVVNGSPATGFYYPNTADPNSGNDNSRPTTKNFRYEFTVDPSFVTQSGGYFYLAVRVNDDESVNKDFCVTFAYSKPYTAPPQITYVAIQAEQMLPKGNALLEDVTDEEGNTRTCYKSVPHNAIALRPYMQKYAKGADGLYYASSDGETADGPLLVAYINNPAGCKLFDASFYDMAYEFGNGFAYYSEDQLTRYSYSDTSANGTAFLKSYGEACNSDGVYPLTEELKGFLDYFTRTNGFLKGLYAEEYLPLFGDSEGHYDHADKYFLYFCGCYGDGSEAYPYTIAQRTGDEGAPAANELPLKNGDVYVVYRPQNTGIYTFTGTGAAATVEYLASNGTENTWSGDAASAKFTVKDTTKELVFKYTGTGEGVYNVTIAFEGNGSEHDPFRLVEGANQVPVPALVSGATGVSYAYWYIEEGKTYTITVSGANDVIIYNGQTYQTLTVKVGRPADDSNIYAMAGTNFIFALGIETTPADGNEPAVYGSGTVTVTLTVADAS